MSQLFKVKAFIPDMGSYTTNAHANGTESAEENALWSFNSARRHDGLSEMTLEDFKRWRRHGNITFTPIN